MHRATWEAPPANPSGSARNAHKKHSDDLLDVACLMLATMSPDLQAGLINTNAYDMIRPAEDMFQTQARTERYDATKAFNECKEHQLQPFVVNYNMNNMEKTIAELHSCFKTAELNMGNKNKTKDVLMVKDGGVKRKMGMLAPAREKDQFRPSRVHPRKARARARARARRLSQTKLGPRIAASYAMRSVFGRQNCPNVMKQEIRNEVMCPELPRIKARDNLSQDIFEFTVYEHIPVDLPGLQMNRISGRDHSSTQQLRKVAVLQFRNWKLVQVSEFHGNMIKD
ncbi:hypothetical protein OSB04_un001526 [Centaurea solstitialis]|uniref:Uncharacterized protein n=1 Tax=Centaurea solstitialis TaxID=347529 RepID=A0AA38SFR5_9ASTR|nr:hypothetical protein OSB04_un001526 [Centaurea solstitialis]